MGIHSKILVHWTGKDFEEAKGLSGGEKAGKYLERLRDDYQNGLYVKRTEEEATIRLLKIKHFFRICFTEIRLSQAQTHADLYGKLGIGFTRDFIMNKGGRPVIYIPFKADVCLIEESVRKVYEKSKGNDEVHKELTWLLGQFKRMSDDNGGTRDHNYEEMEWRLLSHSDYNQGDFTEVNDKVRRLRFSPGDVKIIVFPNELTRRMHL